MGDSSISNILSMGRKLETALELFDDAVDLMRCRIRRESPRATEDEIKARIDRWLTPEMSHTQGRAAPFFRCRPET